MTRSESTRAPAAQFTSDPRATGGDVSLGNVSPCAGGTGARTCVQVLILLLVGPAAYLIGFTERLTMRAAPGAYDERYRIGWSIFLLYATLSMLSGVLLLIGACRHRRVEPGPSPYVATPLLEHGL